MVKLKFVKNKIKKSKVLSYPTFLVGSIFSVLIMIAMLNKPLSYMVGSLIIGLLVSLRLINLKSFEKKFWVWYLTPISITFIIILATSSSIAEAGSKFLSSALFYLLGVGSSFVIIKRR